MPPDRLPTPKTLHQKIHGALEALKQGRREMVSMSHIADDMERLEIDDMAEYWSLLQSCVEEAIKDPVACYQGGYPTKRSDKHSIILKKEMWAFVVTIPQRNEKIYFKFALETHSKHQVPYYFHIDCHPSNY